jgi:Zn-finger nucleic acid-binding protein
MARISDKARYCHHCATLIAPQGTAGEETADQCPACGEVSQLVSRSLGGDRISVLECGRCAGMWLGNEVFKHLEEGAQRLAPPEGVGPPNGAQAPGAKGGGAVQAARYRPCPTCKVLMHRRNYGRKSGVIVDTCQAHGVWFDQGELDAILNWIRRGGLARAREWARKLEVEERRTLELGQRSRSTTSWLDSDVAAGGRPIADLVEGVLRYLAR